MTYTVLPAQPEDWRAYREIRLRALREAPDAFGSTYDHESGFADAQWQERIAGGRLFLAREDQRVVGTATALPAGRDVDLVGMFVAEQARGRGCAQLLLDAVLEAARTAGARRVVLHVTEANVAATLCYTRYGFTPTGRRWPMERDATLTEVEYDCPVDR